MFTRFGYRLFDNDNFETKKNLKKKRKKKIPNSGSYLEKMEIEIIHSFKKFFDVVGQKIEIYMPIETLIRGRKAEK